MGRWIGLPLLRPLTFGKHPIWFYMKPWEVGTFQIGYDGRVAKPILFQALDQLKHLDSLDIWSTAVLLRRQTINSSTHQVAGVGGRGGSL